MLVANVLQPLIAAEEWTLEALHALGLGWGLAIVVLTMLVRLATVPLVVRHYRAQRKLREHMPELKRLQQRHSADRERLQQELRAYRRKHAVNPLAAIVPVLVQIPIFISLYYLMRADINSGLFGDEGFLFIGHLTEQPHGATLAVLSAAYLSSQVASSVIATRTMQRQRRGFAIALPLLFVGLVARFPAGLAVYWITTSVWGLAQQIAFWRLSAGPIAASDAIGEDATTTNRSGAPKSAATKTRAPGRRRPSRSPTPARSPTSTCASA